MGGFTNKGTTAKESIARENYDTPRCFYLGSIHNYKGKLAEYNRVSPFSRNRFPRPLLNPNILKNVYNVDVPHLSEKISHSTKGSGSTILGDHDSIVHQLNPSEEARLRQRKHYFANVTMIDHAVGQITECLKDNDLSENTIIIFTSDHGDCLTDHGHSQKWTMFEKITRVPLIFSGVGIQKNRKIEELVQWMDVGPTILDLAQCDSPSGMEALSMLPAVMGDSWKGRDYVFCEQVGDMVLTDAKFMSMIRSKTWKLIHFLDSTEGQMYDLVNDPTEQKNLWNSSDYEMQKQSLLIELLNWRVKSQLDHSNCWIHQNP